VGGGGGGGAHINGDDDDEKDGENGLGLVGDDGDGEAAVAGVDGGEEADDDDHGVGAVTHEALEEHADGGELGEHEDAHVEEDDAGGEELGRGAEPEDWGLGRREPLAHC
jgi:hypothetical protein